MTDPDAITPLAVTGYATGIVGLGYFIVNKGADVYLRVKGKDDMARLDGVRDAVSDLKATIANLQGQTGPALERLASALERIDRRV